MQGVFDFYADLPARPKRPERLFFALLPDAASGRGVKRFADGFIRDNGLRGTGLRAERLHVSLQHVGDYPRLKTKFVHAARLSAGSVAMAPFDVTFRRIRSFEGVPAAEGAPRRQPLVLLGDGDGLSELHGRLGAAMARNGLKAAAGFTPHMTLFYGAGAVPPQAIEPIRFVVRDFSLIHSELWLSRYNILGSWPLGAAERIA